MKTGVRRCSLVLIGLFVLVACGGTVPKPPHTGAFLMEGSQYTEMVEFKGGPEEGQTEGIPTTASRRPRIALWYPDVNLGLLVLTLQDEMLRDRDLIAYDATPQDSGVIHITPRSDLVQGAYCLSQGDPMTPAALLPSWCFRVK